MDNLSNKGLIRSAICFGFLSVVGFGEHKIWPMGSGERMMIPQLMTYVVLSVNIGQERTHNFVKFLLSALMTALLFEMLIFGWLGAVGYFSRNGITYVIVRMVLDIFCQLLAALATFGVAKVAGILDDDIDKDIQDIDKDKKDD